MTTRNEHRWNSTRDNPTFCTKCRMDRKFEGGPTGKRPGMFVHEYFVNGRSVGWSPGKCGPHVPAGQIRKGGLRQDSDSGNPIREAIRAVTGAEPPSFVVGHSLHGLSGEEKDGLQAWAASNARPEWATGLSMIEAAELIIRESVLNGNIECQCCGTQEMVDDRLEDEAEGNTRHRPCEVCT